MKDGGWLNPPVQCSASCKQHAYHFLLASESKCKWALDEPWQVPHMLVMSMRNHRCFPLMNLRWHTQHETIPTPPPFGRLSWCLVPAISFEMVHRQCGCLALRMMWWLCVSCMAPSFMSLRGPLESQPGPLTFHVGLECPKKCENRLQIFRLPFFFF